MTKAFIFAPCIVDTPQRLERNIKWLDYYEPIRHHFGVEDIWLVDNASPMAQLSKLGGAIYNAKLELLQPARTRPYLKIIRYEQRYERDRWSVMHYWWRAMFTGWQTIRRFGRYGKAIHIDTDVFVLKERLAIYIKNLNSGWVTFDCAMHSFPEATFHILCRDHFETIDEFIANSFPIEKYNDIIPEHMLEFTEVLKDFVGDRYGEIKKPQTTDMDFYAQANLDTMVIWEMND